MENENSDFIFSELLRNKKPNMNKRMIWGASCGLVPTEIPSAVPRNNPS